MILSPAKINLYLEVVGKRSDGYHLLDSLCVFANKGDKLSFYDNKDNNNITIEITGLYGESLKSLDMQDNIIYRTASMLQDHYAKDRGVHIVLSKDLPIASGIGGGSSNSATTLIELNKLWGLNISKKNLATLGQQIGADVSMCIYKQACYVSGVGEKITLLDNFKPIHAILVNPNIESYTQQIFKDLNNKNQGKYSQPLANKPTDINDLNMLIEILKYKNNDLQSFAINRHQIIQDVLKSIANNDECMFTRMTGSGATCFGIFKNKDDSLKALEKIKISNPTWWATDVTLGM